MESGASKLYDETLRVLKENQTIEVLYEVHHPCQSGFQHGCQLHGYVDGLFLQQLQGQGPPFVYENRFEIEYFHLVPDNTKLRFLYRQAGIRPYPRQGVVSFEYRVDVTDQEDPVMLYFTATFKGSGPAENLRRNR